MFLVLKNKASFWCYFCCLVIVCFFMYESTQTNVSGMPVQNFCVVLDAGHGGIDGGSQGDSGVYERDLNLMITNKIEKYLKAMNVCVIKTRTSQEGLYGVFASGFKMKDLNARKRIITNSNADLVVSIHMNFFADKSARGAQVFYKPNCLVSKELADNLQNLFQKNLKNARKNSAKGDFFVLTCTNKPGILIECGYLSNPEEEKLLLNEDYQNQIAYQIFCGITMFFGLNK